MVYLARRWIGGANEGTMVVSISTKSGAKELFRVSTPHDIVFR